MFIFLGGFTASLFAEEIMLNYPQIDAIIRGDAEVPIVKLCMALNDEMLRNKAATTPGIDSVDMSQLSASEDAEADRIKAIEQRIYQAIDQVNKQRESSLFQKARWIKRIY